MANLNLSEFTEKLFVADADHTFIWDTANAISKRVSRNSWLSGTTADFHLGLADAATAVAQTISVQSVVAGTTNTAGANFSINGSQGTGTGAGGSLLLRTAPAGSSGTAQNALVTAVAITSAGNVGIGTTSPSSKLHVEDASPTLTIKNSSASGFGALSFVNTVFSSGNGIWQNGSAQTGFGGASSLNIQASSGPLAFHTATVTNAISLAQNGTCTHAGHLIFAADYSYDIGASGANRPRTIYVGTSVNVAGSTFSYSGISFTDWAATFGYSSGSSYNHNSSNKALKLTFGGSELLQFGGTTSSFPAIKRSTTYLQARLSDDSGFAPIQGKLTTDTAFTSTTVTPTGFITLYDSTGTAYKVPCVPA